MYVTMKEYMKAKGVSFEDLPIISQSPESFYETTTFFGGITACFLKKHRTGKACVWFPEEAKLINRHLAAQVISRHSAHNLIIENNNNNVLVFEKFGDISVLWTVPVTEKIIKNITCNLNGVFKNASYVGYSAMFSFKNIGNQDVLAGQNTFPVLESQLHSADTIFDELSRIFGFLEVALGSDFPHKLFSSLNYKFMGYNESRLYLLNQDNEIIVYSYFRNPIVSRHIHKPSISTTRLIDELLPKRF